MALLKSLRTDKIGVRDTEVALSDYCFTQSVVNYVHSTVAITSVGSFRGLLRSTFQ